MSIAVTCSCGRRLLPRDEFLGQQVKCPYCGQWVTVTPMEGRSRWWRSSGSASDSQGEPSDCEKHPAAPEGEFASETSFSTQPIEPDEPSPRRRGIPRPEVVSTARLVQTLTAMAVGLAVAGAVVSRLSDSLWGASLAALGMLPACLALILSHSTQMVLAILGLLCSVTVATLILTERQVTVVEVGDSSPRDSTDRSALGGNRLGIDSSKGSNPQAAENDWTLAWDPDVRGPMRASLISAEIADPLSHGLVTTGKELAGDPASRLILSLRIRNTSATEVLSWQVGRVRLVDERGREYPNLKRMSGRLQTQFLLPGQTILEPLIFAAPPPGVLNLDLELANGTSSAARGESPSFRLRIPAAMVKR